VKITAADFYVEEEASASVNYNIVISCLHFALTCVLMMH